MLSVQPRAAQGNYMKAYAELLPETSRPWAPWYVIPADHKPYCQMVVCDIVRRAVEGLNLSYVIFHRHHSHAHVFPRARFPSPLRLPLPHPHT